MAPRLLGVVLTAWGLVMLLLPLLVSAQSLQSTDSFSIALAPQFPAPHSTVTLTPTSGLVDLSLGTMTVSMNGKKVYSGNAQQPIKLQVGNLGVPSVVKVVVTVNKESFTKTLTVTPQDVVIVAEPIASTPPLYPGKPLVPQSGTVRIVALASMKTPTGKSIDPAALSYIWNVDGTLLHTASGIGKTSVVVASPMQYRERQVSVTVQTQDGASAGSASLALNPQDPTIRLYKNDPLLGILFDHTVSGTLTLSGAETSMYAAPFSFPTVGGAPTLNWFLNGSSVQRGNTITLRPTGSGGGTASLSVVGSSGDTVSATNNLSVSFGSSNSGGGFFGL